MKLKIKEREEKILDVNEMNIEILPQYMEQINASH
jgi:hypothetical protein